MAGIPPSIRWVVVANAAIWVVMELGKSITRRPEGVRANLGSELLFRLSVGGGAVLAAGLSGVERSAEIRPVVLAVGARVVASTR